jgi:hypothetical protein
MPYIECRDLFNVVLDFIMLTVIILSIFMLNVVMLSVVASLLKCFYVGAGKTTYLLSARFRYGNGYLASYPDLT